MLNLQTCRSMNVKWRYSGWAAFCVALGILVAGGCSSEPKPSTRATKSVEVLEAPEDELPPMRASRYRNIGPEVKYVGNDACANCHLDEFNSYLHTTHSRALDSVALDKQPPGGEVLHEPSGRTYRIFHRDGRMWHREFVRDPDGNELLLAEHPMRYVMGSGNHSRTYLVDIDGFLFESPVTWYTSKKEWDMSPGFKDDPLQPGFARPVLRECVNCHAGQVEPVGDSLQRLRIRQNAIGCEKCHGPGSLHVAEREANKELTGDLDESIVNPARLPRDRQEAICGQCHLAAVAEANVRGRTLADFRPSLLLSDFRVRFQLEAESSEMTVVGHVEQMRASRCYQDSPKMSCITCHSMHSTQGPKALAGRQSCLSCHDDQACGLEPDVRLKRSPSDNCVTCHMPKSDTDIPHFAFHHHRIGIHDESKAPQTRKLADGGELVPIDDMGHLPKIEQDRLRGLAHAKYAEEGKEPSRKEAYQRAMKYLKSVIKQGLEDPEVDATVARICLNQENMAGAIQYAVLALRSKNLNARQRIDALAVLARSYMNQGDFAKAKPFLLELTKVRYTAEDHLMLGVSRFRTGDVAGALESAKKAAIIEPDRPDLQEAVAEFSRLLGDEELSARARRRALQLKQALRAIVGKDDR